MSSGTSVQWHTANYWLLQQMLGDHSYGRQCSTVKQISHIVVGSRLHTAMIWHTRLSSHNQRTTSEGMWHKGRRCWETAGCLGGVWPVAHILCSSTLFKHAFVEADIVNWGVLFNCWTLCFVHTIRLVKLHHQCSMSLHMYLHQCYSSLWIPGK